MAENVVNLQTLLVQARNGSAIDPVVEIDGFLISGLLWDSCAERAIGRVVPVDPAPTGR